MKGGFANVTYEIVGGSTKFELRGAKLLVKEPLDYELTNHHELTVRATIPHTSGSVVVTEVGVSVIVTDVEGEFGFLGLLIREI